MSKGTVNKTILIGRLGQDVVAREGNFGTIVTNSIATNSRVLDNDNEWTDRTDWHNVVFKRQQAQYIRDYAHKGDLIYIEGENQTRKWTDKGITHYRHQISVSQVSIIKSKNPQSGHQQTPHDSTGNPANDGAGQPNNDFDDDIPF